MDLQNSLSDSTVKRSIRMCRLFAFRSVIPSQVHQSLIQADNGLCELSQEHPDGWGVSYYLEGSPHVVKSENAAFDDHIFKRVSGVVSSETVLAHIRKSTLGSHSILNTHPFQHGRWVFAHNGNVKNWDSHREELRKFVLPELVPYILGETDSEMLFFIMLSELRRNAFSLNSRIPAKHIISACASGLKKVIEKVGPFLADDEGPNSETYLTFILTDGSSIVGFQGGKNLYYSTHKTKCSEADTCRFFEASCHAPPADGFVNHLIFSSAPIEGENVWLPMSSGSFVGSDDLQMKQKLAITFFHLDDL